MPHPTGRRIAPSVLSPAAESSHQCCETTHKPSGLAVPTAAAAPARRTLEGRSEVEAAGIEIRLDFFIGLRHEGVLSLVDLVAVVALFDRRRRAGALALLLGQEGCRERGPGGRRA